MSMKEMQQGWEFIAKNIGANMGAQNAFSAFMENVAQNNPIHQQNDLIKQINKAIDDMAKAINEHKKLGLGIEQFKGFVAEEWHAGTFNIDALRKGSEHRAWTLHKNGYASVDVETNFGKQYSLKYSNTAKDAETMQAALNPDTRSPKYFGQERLIADEQVSEAQEWAKRRLGKDRDNRPDVSFSHKDTAEHLTGNISDGEGVESAKLSIKDSRDIAKEAKSGGFDPEKHGYSKDPLLEEIRINYVNEVLKAGLTAAAITVAIQITPEIYKSIDYLVKNGEINLQQIKEMGLKGISAGAESFLNGSVSAAIVFLCGAGKLGETLEGLSSSSMGPSIIGSVVVLIMQAIKNSILVAAGKMTARQMGEAFIDSIIISSGFIAGNAIAKYAVGKAVKLLSEKAASKIAGMICQAATPHLPMIGFIIGTLIGTSFSVLYSVGKNKLISFCVDSGFTCFGLVDQNYELPDEMLKELGVDTITIPRANVDTIDIPRINVATATIEQTQYETVGFTMVKRGVIGVNKVGYVLA